MEVVTSASLLHPLHLRAKRREPQLLPSPSATFPSRSRLRGGASRVCIGRRWTYSVPQRQRYLLFKTNALKGEGEVPDVVDGRILAGSMVTVALAVANRVVYKLALVPMKDYPFFLAQVTTFGYAAVYFAILYVRYRAGIVTTVMLGVPKSLFMAIGLLEALGVAAGMSAGSQLPGPAIPILSQTFLVWQLIFSVLILGRRYSYNQVFGCLLIAVGVVLAVASGANEGQFLSEIGLLWPALMIASSAFQAGASILKEFVFIDGAKRLQGKPLDIFVVNSFGSGFQVVFILSYIFLCGIISYPIFFFRLCYGLGEHFIKLLLYFHFFHMQALFVFLLLPLLSNLRGIPFTELPTYLKNGAGCFFNAGYSKTGCEGAPLLPLLFIATNMAFNILLLNLVKMSSALVSSLVVTVSVPMSISVLSLPLPYEYSSRL